MEKELKRHLTIPNYVIQYAELLPLTKQYSVAILCIEQVSFILHSDQDTLEGVAKDLNKQYAKRMVTETEQVHIFN
jgi:predicted metal-binding protein